eukprot:6141657-Prymnesium_polylepis.1
MVRAPVVDAIFHAMAAMCGSIPTERCGRGCSSRSAGRLTASSLATSPGPDPSRATRQPPWLTAPASRASGTHGVR